MVASSRRRPSAIDDAPGDFELREIRAAAELLDGVAVVIARREVHGREVRRLVQFLVDETHALEELRPVDVGHQPHAGDDVAHGDVGGALAQVLFLEQALGGRALGFEPGLQPQQGRRRLRILVAQAMDQLHGECRRERRVPLLPFRQRRGIRHPAIHAQESIRDEVGFLPCRAADDDALRDAAQVLDQHDAQRDRHGPQFTDGQGFDGLVRVHETPQRLGIEPTVRVRDEGPGDAKYPRETVERPGGEFRELTIEPRRQILADLTDLFLDHVVVVEHPFGGGRDAASFVDGSGDRPIGGQQHLLVVAQARTERAAEPGRGADRLGGGKAARVLFESLDAEDLLAEDLLVVPVRARGQSSDDGAENGVQESAGLRWVAAKHYANSAPRAPCSQVSWRCRTMPTRRGRAD
jgi:hypothetical protein